LELGPGNVLSGLVKKISPKAAVRSLSTALDIIQFMKEQEKNK